MQVVAATSGSPDAVLIHGDWVTVRTLRRPWLVDQLWWRSRPVNRLYFQVAPEEGPPFTLFHDLLSGDWFLQEYQ